MIKSQQKPFLLFVMQNGKQSEQAQKNLRRAVGEQSFCTVDIRQRPDLARYYGVRAVPTLVKHGHSTVAISGTLSDESLLARTLGVQLQESGDVN